MALSAKVAPSARTARTVALMDPASSAPVLKDPVSAALATAVVLSASATVAAAIASAATLPAGLVLAAARIVVPRAVRAMAVAPTHAAVTAAGPSAAVRRKGVPRSVPVVPSSRRAVVRPLVALIATVVVPSAATLVPRGPGWTRARRLPLRCRWARPSACRPRPRRI